MDSFTLKNVNGKIRLTFDGHVYGYSNPIGNTGCRWSCPVKTCPAHLNTNKAKDRIIGGDFNHTCEKNSPKSSPSTPRSEQEKANTNKTANMTPATDVTPKVSQPNTSIRGSSQTPAIVLPTQTQPDGSSGSGSSSSTPQLQNSSQNSDPNEKQNDLLNQRNAAIDTIVSKEIRNDELRAELEEARSLITSLQNTIQTLEAAWEVDRNELNNLRKQIASTPNNQRVKLTIVGDSHVHNLEPILRKLFPSKYDVKCYAKSGSGVEGAEPTLSIPSLSTSLSADLDASLSSLALSSDSDDDGDSDGGNIACLPGNSNSLSLSNGRISHRISPFPKCLSCIHLNAQSLSAHMHEIRTLIDNADLHAILISESWLKPSISDSLVNISGYTLVRHDRLVRRGGGVAMYIRNDLTHKVLVRSTAASSQDDKIIEFMAVELVVRSIKILLTVVYKPPKANQLDELYDLIVSVIPQYEHIILMGDFNINLLDSNSSVATRFAETMTSYNLTVLPSAPTHHSPNHPSSLLDLSIVSRSEKVMMYEQIPAPGVSHHDLLLLSYSVKVPKYPPQMITYRNIKSINMDNFSEVLDGQDWRAVESDNDLNVKVTLLNEKLIKVFDRFAPVKKARATRAPIPWMTPAIRSSMRERDKLCIRYRHTRSQESLQAYKSLKNRTNYMVRKAQSSFARGILHGGPKSTWKKLNSVGLGNVKSLSPISIDLNQLNDFFVSVVPSPCSILKTTVLERLENEPVPVSLAADVKFDFEEVSAENVRKAILSIKSKAPGYDGVDLVMVKMSLSSLLPTITHVFNVSLTTGRFPDFWKFSNVVPLNKVGNPSSCADYRPISLLPLLSKGLEKIVVQQILSFVETHNIVDPYQSGFRRFHSTTTALVKVTNDIRGALDEKKVTLLALLDMSKAFDSVDFDILLKTLEKLHFSENALSWIGSYLRGRQQRIFCEGRVSDWRPIRSGVPQGSVAGPLLFALYISTAQNVFRHCRYHIYADDVQIYLHCLPRDVANTIQLLNEDLERFSAWAKSLFLKPNPSKTQVMLVGTNSFVLSLSSLNLPPILLDGQQIQFTQCAKNLGVHIDSTLSWSKHVANIRKKVFYSLHTLVRVVVSTSFLAGSTYILMLEILDIDIVR
ncbi:hypothetical protein M8J77_008146 [Diaphorina citri]|nr:hypothetical protein M8J77_008146 [Diaphorina citri]